MTIVLGIFGFLFLISGVGNAFREHLNGRENWATVYGVVALFGLGMMVGPAFMKGRATTPAEAAVPVQASLPVNPRGTPEEQAALIAASQVAVRVFLKDPYSAQFGYDLVKVKNGVRVVCGMVNAKGGFGSYTGLKRYVSLGSVSNTVIDNNEFEFGNTWRRFCD